MKRIPSTPKFSRLVAVSLAATALMVTAGSSLLHWRTGWHGLPAAMVGAVAALTPLLMVGYIAAAAAARYSGLTAGSMFVGLRLTTMRFSVAISMLAVGREVTGVGGGSPVMWFALLYVTLLIVEAWWLAVGLQGSTDLGEDD